LGLDEPPFRITPHTDFFFDGAERGATLEALAYAVLHDEGIVKVSGEVGSGKTMLCRMLMERLPREVETIYLATPSLARDEILHAIADDLELKLSDRRSVALRELQEHLITLYGAGRRVVILIDEAHVMPEDTLEQVRLLSNLESSRHKLLQMVLFGQPELDATLAKASLRQLRDRITHSFRMRPLAAAEVAKYLAFRMRAAGYRGPDVFAPRAANRIARASGGLTRRINILADKALLAAFTENLRGVTERHVRAAIADAEFAVPTRAPKTAWYLAAAVAAGLAIGIAIHWTLSRAPVAPVQAAMMQELVSPEPQPPAPALPALREEQIRRFLAYSPGRQRLLEERIAATREALEQAPDETYALELFVTDNPDPGRMERFLVRASELVPLERLFVIPMSAAGRYRLRVLLGQYMSLEEALNAARTLPPRYQQAFRAAPRSFAQLREEI
jgi:type II secretory pathway predicted ATPase ExeA